MCFKCLQAAFAVCFTAYVLLNIVNVFEHIILLIHSPSFDGLSEAYLCVFGCFGLKLAACKRVLGIYRPL